MLKDGKYINDKGKSETEIYYEGYDAAVKEMFRYEIEQMEDSDFKKQILDNFDAITGTDEEYKALLKETLDKKNREYEVQEQMLKFFMSNPPLKK